mmetsp:Transcript_22518/g.67052  ORF Transcript_22518/g.67052 Transcript_22518/m.67052 type:complete len:214 (-) Transcript_22518:1145-1786(-)
MCKTSSRTHDKSRRHATRARPPLSELCRVRCVFPNLHMDTVIRLQGAKDLLAFADGDTRHQLGAAPEDEMHTRCRWRCSPMGCTTSAFQPLSEDESGRGAPRGSGVGQRVRAARSGAIRVRSSSGGQCVQVGRVWRHWSRPAETGAAVATSIHQSQRSRSLPQCAQPRLAPCTCPDSDPSRSGSCAETVRHAWHHAQRHAWHQAQHRAWHHTE